MSYTEVEGAAWAFARAHARGCYQRALLAGREAWSGATLRGKAKTYGARYARSRASLLARLRRDPRLAVREYYGNHNKRTVEITLAP